MTEAWAEFLGQTYTNRQYPNGSIFSFEFGYSSLNDLREKEHYFADEWICKGIFNDLIDGGNSGLSNTELWDNVSGRTIYQLYNLFGPNVINVQDYKAAYVRQFGGSSDFQDIAVNNRVTP